MPHLAALLACERTVIEAETNQVSLIALTEMLTVQVPLGADLANLKIPYRWTLFSLWQDLEEEQGKMFHQVTEVLAPDRETLLTHTIVFQAATPFHRTYMHGNAFPVGQQGAYLMRTALYSEDDLKEPLATGQYSVLVQHEFVEESVLSDNDEASSETES